MDEHRYPVKVVCEVVGTTRRLYETWAPLMPAADPHPGRGAWRSWTARDIAVFAVAKRLRAVCLDHERAVAVAAAHIDDDRLEVAVDPDVLPHLTVSVDVAAVRANVARALAHHDPIDYGHAKRRDVA